MLLPQPLLPPERCFEGPWTSLCVCVCSSILLFSFAPPGRSPTRVHTLLSKREGFPFPSLGVSPATATYGIFFRPPWRVFPVPSGARSANFLPCFASSRQTQGVLLSLPEDMRHTLTRPGIMHTLPRPVQDLLLPPNAAAAANGRGAVGSRRRRRLAGTEGFATDGTGGYFRCWAGIVLCCVWAGEKGEPGDGG